MEAAPVTAIFFGFHPDFVARAVPDVWSRCPPSRALEARLVGADGALRSALGDRVASADVARAADLLRSATAAVSGDRRPLFAANAALGWPEEPHLVLWQAATVLREHRGDGHVASLVNSGLGPCEAHVLRLAVGGGSPESIQPYRGWTAEDWNAAGRTLQGRGLLNPGSTATAAGRALSADVEATTDRLAEGPVAALGDDVSTIEEILRPVVAHLEETGVIPYPNPMGVPRFDA